MSTLNFIDQWQDDDAPHELTLPSGKTVLVRTPDVLTMTMRGGLIPDVLTPLIEKYVFEKEQIIARANATDQPPGDRLKHYAEFMKCVDIVAVGACVNPVLRFTPKKGELAIDRLTVADRLAIYMWAEGLTAPLAAFPARADGEDALLPAVDRGAGDEPAAEPVPGPDLPA